MGVETMGVLEVPEALVESVDNTVCLSEAVLGYNFARH